MTPFREPKVVRTTAVGGGQNSKCQLKRQVANLHNDNDDDENLTTNNLISSLCGFLN